MPAIYLFAGMARSYIARHKTLTNPSSNFLIRMRKCVP